MARILGLDIDHHAVRGTLVRTAVRNSEVLRYIQVPIEPADDPQGRADNLRESVRTVVSSMHRSPDGVVAELEGYEASLRVVELPAGASKRIAEVLPYELESLLPFPIEDSIIDYQIIERTQESLRLLAACAPRNKVANRLDQLRDAGVDPRELAVGAAALEGLVPLLPQLQTAGPHVIVDVGEETTDVCILRNGHCELARTLSSGMRVIRQGQRGQVEAQLRHTLARYRATDAPEPEMVYLAGYAAAHSDALEWLGSVTGIEARVLPLPPVEGADDASRPLFARPAGLAGRVALRGKRIDARQGEFARRRAVGAIRQHTRLIAICAAVVLASFGFSTYARWAMLDDEREALEARLGRVTKQLFDQKVTDPTRAENLISGGSDSDDPLPRFDAYHTLEAISRKIPEEITHDTRRLNIDFDDKKDEGHFELHGTVDTISQRDTIAGKLEEHPCIRELEKGRTTPGPGDEGLNYQLEAVVKCPEGGPPSPSGGPKQARRSRGGR